MSCWPVGAYLAAVPARAPAAPDAAKPFEDGAPAALGAPSADPEETADELAEPEQPATAAMRITLGTTATASRRRRGTRAENDAARAESEEHEERAGTARLIRMPLG